MRSSQAAALVFLGLLSLSGLAEAKWQPHQVKQRDPQGKEVTLPAQRQTLSIKGQKRVLPFGLIQMDNGEIAMIASRESDEFLPVITFSADGGDTWSDFKDLPGSVRPMHLMYLGQGKRELHRPTRAALQQ